MPYRDRVPVPVPKDYDYASFGNQVKLGERKPSKYEVYDAIPAAWQSDSNGKFWSGVTTHLTPEELANECLTTLQDIAKYYPDAMKSIIIIKEKS